MMLLFASDTESSSSSRTLLIGVSVVAIAAALYLGFALRRNASGQANAAGSATPYVCWTDGQSFSLTPAQFDQKLKEGDVQSGSSDGSRGGVLKLRCPRCHQFTAVIASKCPKDSTLIPVVDQSGQPGKCPRCGSGFVPSQ